MNSGQRWCSAMVAVVAGCVCSLAAAQQKLRWDLQEGQSFAVRLQQQTSTKTKVAGASVAMELDMRVEMAWKVTAVDDAGNARIAQEFTRLSIDVDGPGTKQLSFDTASDEEPSDEVYALAESLSPLIGAEFQVTMSNRGEITEVSIPDATRNQLRRSAATSRIRKLLEANSLNELLRQSLAILPETEVAEGDTWQSTHAVQSPLGQIDQQHTFKFDGTVEQDQKQLVVITVKTQLDLKLPEDSQEEPAESAAPVKAKLEKQEQSGRLWFDPELGRFLRSEIKQRLGTRSTYRGQSIDVQVDTTTNMTLGPGT